MKLILPLILFLSALFLYGCSSPAYELIEGSWAIDIYTMKHNGENHPEHFYGNMITFENNGSCKLPEINIFCKLGYDMGPTTKSGKWTLEENNNNYILHISSNNEIFAGDYLLKFMPNEKTKILSIWLISDKTKLKADKLLFDFDANHVLIDKISHE